MPDSNHQDSGVDAIIKKIGDEAQRRKAELSEPQGTDDFPPGNNECKIISTEIQEAPAEGSIKENRAKQRTFPFYQYCSRFAGKLSKVVPQEGESISVNDLLRYHDEEFIDNAYRTILGRAADPHASVLYAANLRNGQMTKIEILGNLRYSIEGNLRNVNIKGLYPRFKLQRAYKFPILGYLLSTMVLIMTLPLIVKRTRANEARLQESEAVNRARYLHVTALLQSLKNRQQDMLKR